ncbi:hypothetical protein BKH41_01850 [Helicobacter sp. 12S02232-10]|uniref:ArdC family protein n=1 Tax=Helicobacter sp. 12S02232-10 TaxID=1476197 RepID=UPI000BA6DD12|nr:ArdC family protein [Helicobacter sp. 12S02232-10]PAF49434.1 hypothetical protein BKH41_01850 [Helicobacter sp. 12S02232-10]
MSEKKTWTEMNLEEKKATFGNYLIYEIIKSAKEGYAPFQQKTETFDRAYNGLNGVPYHGLNSLILDIKQKEGKYQSNVWASLKDAKNLGASKEEIEAVFNDNSIPKAKVSFIKTFELQPVYKLDINGNKIPYLNQDGSQAFDKDKNPLFQYELEPNTDKNGNIKINLKTNQPYMKIKTERIDIEPTLESTFLYNIDAFQTIDKSKIKPIKVELFKKSMLWHSKDFDHSKTHIIFGDIEKNFNKTTAEQIKEYLIAQNNSKSYEPPIKLNETQKNQVDYIVDYIVEKKLEEMGIIEKKEDKYKLLENDTAELKQTKLYRIEALRDFDDVKVGDKGGYIESEENLSHTGNALHDNAHDNAKAYDSAVIGSGQQIYGDVAVKGSVEVYHDKDIRNQKDLDDYMKKTSQTNSKEAVKETKAVGKKQVAKKQSKNNVEMAI